MVRFEREVRAHAEVLALDVTLVVAFVALANECLEFEETRDARQRHEVATAETADLTFDATFFVRAFDARQAEEGVEEVVTAQLREALGLDATATL